jgi:hypothetical protein
VTEEAIDQQVAALRATIDWLLAQKRPRAPADTPDNWLSPSQATAICGRSESQVRRDCESNPLDNGGFGLRRGGRWLIKEARYREMRGDARFRR